MFEKLFNKRDPKEKDPAVESEKNPEQFRKSLADALSVVDNQFEFFEQAPKWLISLLRSFNMEKYPFYRGDIVKTIFEFVEENNITKPENVNMNEVQKSLERKAAAGKIQPIDDHDKFSTNSQPWRRD